MAVVVASWCSQVAIREREESGTCSTMGEKEPPVLYKRYLCSFPDCNATYNKNWKLQAHLCKHTGQKPFTCTYEGCGKDFTTLYHLTRHSMTHSGEKPCKCESEDCDLRFSTTSNMKKHYKRAHTSPRQLFVCYFTECGREFKKHNQLKVHQYIHTNQHPFKCTHEGCDKNFSAPSKLKRHEKVHAGYPCQKDSDCPFVGKTWTDYLKHVAVSHSEPAVCDVCNRKFKTKLYLKDHKKSHGEERFVYRCPREGCTRTYTTKFNLQSHIISFHDDLRSFACEHDGCGKTFAMKQSLDRHVNTHDPQKKKMEKPPRPKRSLASRLSGYKPKKSSKKRSTQKSLPDSVSEKLPEAPKSDEDLILDKLSLK
ncbi:transcription factor IIIA [Mixophyes fleayi]|uniref:transcription factor IIIA n=1 Tax=Mixophyes fleayi TaxID=3061075 RepID=UPI003F4DBE47